MYHTGRRPSLIGQIMQRSRYARRGYMTGNGNGYNGNAMDCYGQPNCPPYSAVPILNAPVDKKRRWGVSFLQAILASAQGVAVTVRPQHCFRPDQLIIPSTIAPNFDIVSIVIGTQPQLVATGVTSATIYSEVSVNNQQIFDVCQPGIEVIITVNNLTAAAQTFQATLLGAALD